MNKAILYIPLALFSLGVQAQESSRQWTLEECINYAIEHNIDLKQKVQVQENKKVELNTSKYSWLPNLNGNIGQDFNFGRSPSNDGVIRDISSSNTSLSVGTSMPLFTGLKIINDIKARKFDLLASTENLNKAKEDLAINVTSYYMQVLFNKELLTIAQLQADLSAEQVKKTEALVNAGKVPLSQLYDIKAQLAKDQVTLTDAQNNVNLSTLDLSQSLELERSGESFNIKTPRTDDPIALYISSIVPPDDIYNHAVTFKPQIREQTYLLESSKKMLNVAKAGYLPKLDFNASYSNGYFDSQNISFSEQFRKNERKTIGFSLSIPLFNRFQVRNSIRSSRIAIVNQELMMENTKKVLYKEIQQAYYNAVASQEKYNSAEKSVVATQEAFQYAEQRYETGKSTVYEYNEAKTKYTQSLSDQVQAKYDFIFRTKILDFYNGTPIKL